MTSDAEDLGNVERVFGSVSSDLVGYFRFYFADRRWEWSDEVYRIHGYEPGQVVPTTDVLLSHKHPDDRERVAGSLQRLMDEGLPFGSWHRIIDRQGTTHQVLVVGDRMFDDDGTAIGTDGYYVDLTDTHYDHVQAGINDALAEISDQRAVVEQVKGMLMLVYGIDAQRAFDVLLWRSQSTNVKLRDLAGRLRRDVVAESTLVTPHLRQTFDHLLLTAHERVEN